MGVVEVGLCLASRPGREKALFCGLVSRSGLASTPGRFFAFRIKKNFFFFFFFYIGLSQNYREVETVLYYGVHHGRRIKEHQNY